MALAAYRRILRSIPVAFKEDTFILANARLKARQLFEEGRRLKQSSEDAIKAIQHAEDVARMLRQNVVQGRAEGSGEQFRLRIHDETERGDNETIKMAGEKMKEKAAQR